MNEESLHILPRDGGGWVVQRDDSHRHVSVHHSKSEALAAARELARRKNVELVIHRGDGDVGRPNG